MASEKKKKKKKKKGPNSRQQRENKQDKVPGRALLSGRPEALKIVKNKQERDGLPTRKGSIESSCDGGAASLYVY